MKLLMRLGLIFFVVVASLIAIGFVARATGLWPGGGPARTVNGVP